MDQLERLANRAEINDVMFRYARGVDRRDWQSVRACFHDDATDDHADFKGAIDEFIPWVSKMHAALPDSCHFLGNSLIEFASETKAVVETYFFAVLRLGAQSGQHRAMLASGSEDAATGDTDLDVIGRYVDHFEKRDGAWRIARRVVVFDRTRTQPTQDSPLKPHWALGRRDGDDPIYAWRRQAGLR